jgi:twitching motility protein PilT
MTQKIEEILRAAVERRVSDTHFSADECIWMRVDGDLVRYDDHVFVHSELEPLLMSMCSEKERERLKANKNLDKSYFIDGLGNFRVNIFYSRRGIGAVIRSLPSKVPSIDDLHLPEVIKTLASLPKGLILVTGPTGSGKSTTLAAIIDYMNENFAYHILTVEDPVEFIHKPKKSLVNQREIGQSCPTFADALKYALREDPDVILVGELRDLETISLAMTAAETGHLVLGTLHTRGAASTMDRVIETFPSLQQAQARAMLAESLVAVISQTLLKKPGGGRTAVYEIMVMNWAISNLVREGKTFQVPSIIQTGKREGMILMEAHARELLAAGEVTQEDGEALISQLNKSGAPAGKPAGGPPAIGGQKQESAPPPPMKSTPAKPAAVAKAAPPPPTPPVKMEAPKPAPSPAPLVATAPAPAPAPAPAAEPEMTMDLHEQMISLSDDEDDEELGFEGVGELEMDPRDKPSVPATTPYAAPLKAQKPKPPSEPPAPVESVAPPTPTDPPAAAPAAPVAAKPGGLPPAPPLRNGLPPPPPKASVAPKTKPPLPLPVKKTG